MFIQVIDQLLSQYARNQFVAQTLHIELDSHKEVHKLLSNLNDELERRTENIDRRMVKYFQLTQSILLTMMH
jgi:hypothetical protein